MRLMSSDCDSLSWCHTPVVVVLSSPLPPVFPPHPVFPPPSPSALLPHPLVFPPLPSHHHSHAASVQNSPSVAWHCINTPRKLIDSLSISLPFSFPNSCPRRCSWRDLGQHDLHPDKCILTSTLSSFVWHLWKAWMIFLTSLRASCSFWSDCVLAERIAPVSSEISEKDHWW